MVHSKLVTRFALTTDYSSRNGAKIESIGHHHAAGVNLDGVLSLFQPGGRTVSANYCIKDDQIVLVVPEEFRAWTTASAIDDARAITYEICNDSAGPDWRISEATFRSVMRLDADIARRYGIPLKHGLPGFWEHRNIYEWFKRGYATSCAGPSFSISRVIQDTSAEIARQIAAENAAEKASEDDDMIQRKSISSSMDTILSSTEFKHLYINPEKHVTLAFGPSRVNVVANITVKGLEPARLVVNEAGERVLVDPDVAQFRFVRVVAGTNGQPDVVRSEGVGLEIVGNGGSSFGQLSGIIDLAPGERLRIHGIAYANGREVSVSWNADLRVKTL